GLGEVADQLLVETFQADSVAELKPELETARYHEVADLLGPVEVHVEDVVLDHELPDPVGIVEEADLLPYQVRAPPAEPLAEQVVAVDAAVRAAAAREDLDRAAIDGRKADEVDVEVALDVEEVRGRQRRRAAVDVVVARRVAHARPIPAEPQPGHAVERGAGRHPVEKIRPDVLALADTDGVDAFLLHHRFRQDRRMLPAED